MKNRKIYLMLLLILTLVAFTAGCATDNTPDVLDTENDDDNNINGNDNSNGNNNGNGNGTGEETGTPGNNGDINGGGINDKNQ